MLYFVLAISSKLIITTGFDSGIIIIHNLAFLQPKWLDRSQTKNIYFAFINLFSTIR